MSATLLQLAFVVLANSATSSDYPITDLPLGQSAAELTAKFAGATRDATPSEEHDHSNGFGVAKRAMGAKMLGVGGHAIALFGRKTSRLVGMTWSPEQQGDCNRVSQSLRAILGKPSEVSPAMKQATWEEKIGSVEVTLTQHKSSCSVLLLAAEPWEY
jgi:hypothetical protein